MARSLETSGPIKISRRCVAAEGLILARVPRELESGADVLFRDLVLLLDLPRRITTSKST